MDRLTFQNATTNITGISDNASAINVGGIASGSVMNVATGAVSTVSIGGTLFVDDYGTLNIGSAGFASSLTLLNSGTTPKLRLLLVLVPVVSSISLVISLSIAVFH